MSRELKTRDGRKVRILRTDRGSIKFPLVCDVEGVHKPVRYTEDGFYRMNKSEDPRDIMGLRDGD